MKLTFIIRNEMNTSNKKIETDDCIVLRNKWLWKEKLEEWYNRLFCIFNGYDDNDEENAKLASMEYKELKNLARSELYTEIIKVLKHRYVTYRDIKYLMKMCREYNFRLKTEGFHHYEIYHKCLEDPFGSSINDSIYSLIHVINRNPKHTREIEEYLHAMYVWFKSMKISIYYKD